MDVRPAMRIWPMFLFLSGCGPSIRVHDYKNLKIMIMETTYSVVHRECGEEYKACSIPGDPCVIWAYDANDLTHELKHCDGGDEEAAKRDEW